MRSGTSTSCIGARRPETDGGTGSTAREQDGWDDARLVQACRDGDEDAWAALIQRYRRLIYSIPVRYGAQPADAADIFQAVCLELYAELPKLRKVESLRSWLISVTTHQAFHWKQRVRGAARARGTPRRRRRRLPRRPRRTCSK